MRSYCTEKGTLLNAPWWPKCKFSLNNYFIVTSLLTSPRWSIWSPTLDLSYVELHDAQGQVCIHTRCLLLNKMPAGGGAGHLNETVVPMWRGMEHRLLINSQLVRGIHWAQSNTFNKKDILGLPLSMWDANKHTHSSYPTPKIKHPYSFYFLGEKERCSSFCLHCLAFSFVHDLFNICSWPWNCGKGQGWHQKVNEREGKRTMYSRQLIGAGFLSHHFV